MIAWISGVDTAPFLASKLNGEWGEVCLRTLGLPQ